MLKVILISVFAGSVFLSLFSGIIMTVIMLVKILYTSGV
jgi:hypothetical protein